jgi:hypothetical protein
LDVAEVDDVDYDEENFEESDNVDDEEEQNLYGLRPPDINRDHLPYQQPLPETGTSHLFNYISKYSDRMDFNVSAVPCLKDVDRLNNVLIKLHLLLVSLITEDIEVRGIDESTSYQIMSILCVKKSSGRWMDVNSVVPIVNATIYMFRLVTFGTVVKQTDSIVNRFVDDDDKINSAAFAFWMYRICLSQEFGMTVIRPFFNIRAPCRSSRVVIWDKFKRELIMIDNIRINVRKISRADSRNCK